MTLIKSISGVRGTIGGLPGENLTPIDVVEMAASFGQIIKNTTQKPNPIIIIGRDARITGASVSALVSETLLAMGIHVSDVGLSTTPTVEMAVIHHQADAGIIITASHNPQQWNALKFLNNKGEFISSEMGTELIKIATEKSYAFNSVDELGNYKKLSGSIEAHIKDILKLDLVDNSLVASKKFKVVVDCINSTGAISVRPLLTKLGCNVRLINEKMHGRFVHNPEPLPQHLTELSEKVVKYKADLGIAVDPDVDRLCFVCPDGTLLGEENTLVLVAKYILGEMPGPTVSNLSSSRGLRDVTQELKQTYYAAAVGEVNVVNKMKEVGAVIGGEGNGGIIYPALHYGRDALVGIALVLTYMAKNGKNLNQIKEELPKYVISKNKIDLKAEYKVQDIISKLIDHYKKEEVNTEDGLKIDFKNGWVQLRQSNTEPIIRVYSESKDEATSDKMAQDIIKKFYSFAEK